MGINVRTSSQAGCLIVLTIMLIISSLVCLFIGGALVLVGCTEGGLLIALGVMIFFGAFFMLFASANG